MKYTTTEDDILYLLGDNDSRTPIPAQLIIHLPMDKLAALQQLYRPIMDLGVAFTLSQDVLVEATSPEWFHLMFADDYDCAEYALHVSYPEDGHKAARDRAGLVFKLSIKFGNQIVGEVHLNSFSLDTTYTTTEQDNLSGPTYYVPAAGKFTVSISQDELSLLRDMCQLCTKTEKDFNISYKLSNCIVHDPDWLEKHCRKAFQSLEFLHEVYFKHSGWGTVQQAHTIRIMCAGEVASVSLEGIQLPLY